MNFSRGLAAFLVMIAATFSSAAHADDWGCEVLLCLANPKGPMAVSQCVPPIQKLYAAIFKFKPDPFPTCVMASSNNSKNYANVEYDNYYDQCPKSTSALSAGGKAIQGTLANAPAQIVGGGYYVGIGENRAPVPGEAMPPKVCVGNFLGNVNVELGEYDNRYTVTVGVFDRVAFVDPAVNGFAIKVFLDGSLNKVIRPQF
jgi:hypothetical protein